MISQTSDLIRLPDVISYESNEFYGKAVLLKIQIHVEI